MSKTLVLVDAQKGFWCNASKVSGQLESVLRRARETDQRIVVVEFRIEMYGRTHESLQKILGLCDPQRVDYIEKHQNDGSEEVMWAMRLRDWDLEDGIEICGVNLCYCVAETACSLSAHTDVDLLRPAVACWGNCDLCGKDDSHTIQRYRSNGVSINGLSV
jgi:nicotinamidase-related amidase